MNVRVKLFAVARELAGRDELIVEMPAGATVAELRRAIQLECPSLEKVLSHAMWSVDAAYAGDETPLSEQSDVALIPPVSGG